MPKDSFPEASGESEIPIILVCPICRSEAVTTITPNGQVHNCEPCGMRSWNGKPMETKATMYARKMAHNAFDPLWNELNLMSRNKAYKELAKFMGITPKECHIGLFDKRQAEMVIIASQHIYEKYIALQ